jgi:hypothetical protein
MAAVSVTADNTRVAVATIATDSGTWGNDGGGGGVADEEDIVYQTSTAQSRKVGTSIIGRSYTHGSGTNMTGVSTSHYIAKINATNSNVLLSRASPALHMKIGSSSSDYHLYYLFGNDNYPPKGGWQLLAIAPAVTGYYSATDVGSPDDTSILYWSILGDFSVGSKAENVVIDAIDVGLGLGLVGGDGGDTDGVFDDFVSYDEGTGANRYGYVATEGPVVFVIGQLAIGQTGDTQTSTLTVFQDTGVTVVWRNGLVATGFNRLLMDIATSSTDIDITNCTLLSEGQENNDGDRSFSTTEDSRPIFETTGTSGTLGVTGCTFDVWSSFTLNAQCTFSDCVITNSGQIDLGTGATFSDCTVSSTTVAADASALVWDNANDPNGELDNLTITKGTNAHHAIEFGTTSPTSITLTGWTTSGFNASDEQNDSTFNVLRTSGTVTINIIGGSGNFSYKSAGATVNVVISPVTTTIQVKDENDAVLPNARVIIEAGDDSGDLPFEDPVSITYTGITGYVVHTGHGVDDGKKVVIRGAEQQIYNGIFAIYSGSTDAYRYTMTGTPSEDASGSITSTGIVVEGLTNATGIVSASASYSVDQNVRGRVRMATSSPFYKSFPPAGYFTDVVDNANGLTKSIQMIRDD